MIIKNMAEFGKAVDEGTLMQTCNANNFEGWFDFDSEEESWKLSEIPRLISEEAIRIAPPITYYKHHRICKHCEKKANQG